MDMIFPKGGCHKKHAKSNRVKSVFMIRAKNEGTWVDKAPFSAAGRVEFTKFGPQSVFTCWAASSYLEATSCLRSAAAEW